jgi:hypothetical protein
VRRTAFLLAALWACSSAPSRPMSEEERTYRNKCTSCHRAYEPGERKDWPHVLDKMQAEKKTHLKPEDRERILLFLQGHAPPPPSR